MRGHGRPRRPERMSPKKLGLAGVILFATALAVRLLFVWDSSSNPTFYHPIVDAETYDTLARSLAAGHGLTEKSLWQPLFYPFFLSVIYAILGGSIVGAKVIQVALGAVTAILVYRLGKAVFDRPVGILAGVLAACYGPLIFFDAELLATGWACFWSVALILLFLKAANPNPIGIYVLLGICAALSVLTRPTFLPFLVVAAIWLAVTLARQGIRRWQLLHRLTAVVVGFAFVTVPVAALHAHVGGRFTILPVSGSLNLYIGNQPNTGELITVRPGWDWDELTRSPARFGATTNHHAVQFFQKRFFDYVWSQPAGFIKGIAAKAVQFVSSRELPRNVDVYVLRNWSVMLKALVWKMGGFGFPFGVLLPLALLGLVFHWSRVPAPLKLFLLLYPAAVILVFVTGRYRMPVVPILTVLAAAGVFALIDIVRRKRWPMLAATAAGGIVLLWLASVPGPFPQEKTNYEAEMYYVLGSHARDQDRLDDAARMLRRALEIDSSYGDAHNSMGTVLERQGDLEQAAEHYAQAIQINPGHVTARGNLALVRSKQGRLDEAVAEFRRALDLDPRNAKLHNSCGVALARQKNLDDAIFHFRESLKYDPHNAGVCNNLAGALHEHGDLASAIEYYRRALQIDPDLLEALINLAAALQAQGHPDQARDLYRQALQRARAAHNAELVTHLERIIN